MDSSRILLLCSICFAVGGNVALADITVNGFDYEGLKSLGSITFMGKDDMLISVPDEYYKVKIDSYGNSAAKILIQHVEVNVVHCSEQNIWKLKSKRGYSFDLKPTCEIPNVEISMDHLNDFTKDLYQTTLNLRKVFEYDAIFLGKYFENIRRFKFKNRKPLFQNPIGTKTYDSHIPAMMTNTTSNTCLETFLEIVFPNGILDPSKATLSLVGDSGASKVGLKLVRDLEAQAFITQKFISGTTAA